MSITKYWTNLAGGNLVSNPGNWLPTGIPTIGDVLTFDSTPEDCQFNIDLECDGILVNNIYAGDISFADGIDCTFLVSGIDLRNFNGTLTFNGSSPNILKCNSYVGFNPSGNVTNPEYLIISITGVNDTTINYIDSGISGVQLNGAICDVAFDGTTTQILGVDMSGTLVMTDSTIISDTTDKIINGSIDFSHSGNDINLGKANWTLNMASGDSWNSANCGTWNYGTSTVILSGVGSISSNANKQFYNLTLNGVFSTNTDVLVLATADIDAILILGDIFYLRGNSTIRSTSNISGNKLSIYYATALSTIDIIDGAIISPTVLEVYRCSNVTLSAYDYDCPLTITSNADSTVIIGSGNLVCDALTIEQTTAAKTTTLDLSTNNISSVSCSNLILTDTDGILVIDDSNTNINWNITGNVSNAGGGVIQWVPGNGTITFNGSGLQTVAYGNAALESIVINKTNDSLLQLGDGFTTKSFTHQAGIFTPSGQTIIVQNDFIIPNGAIVLTDDDALDNFNLTVSGDFSIAGSSSIPLSWKASAGSANILNVIGTATATYVTVCNSNASGGSYVYANRCTDNGGNINWDFMYPIYELDATGIGRNTISVATPPRDYTRTLYNYDVVERTKLLTRLDSRFIVS